MGRALTDCLPLLALAAVAGTLRLLDAEWAWLTSALACAAYLLFFVAFPFAVSLARAFVGGYRAS